MIVRKKEFLIGLIMMISFFVVFAVLMSPIINGKTVITYADDLFNQLTKGSVYAIPGVAGKAKSFEGKSFTVTVDAKVKEDAEKMTRMLAAAGATVTPAGDKLTVSGDLGKVARTALADADAEFKNNGKEVLARYGFESREAIYYWWNVFNSLATAYKKENKVSELSFVNNVMTKGLEAAYNFEGIDGVSVKEKAGVTTFMLVFYVIYTVWYGFAIMYIMEGLGISASAHGEKAEA